MIMMLYSWRWSSLKLTGRADFWHPTSTRAITTGGGPIVAASSARRGPITLSRTSPGSRSSVGPSSADSSTSTSEPDRSPGQG
jgi:hypothetical protein